MRWLTTGLTTLVRLLKSGPFPPIGYWSDRVTGRPLLIDEHLLLAAGASVPEPQRPLRFTAIVVFQVEAKDRVEDVLSELRSHPDVVRVTLVGEG